MSTATQTESSSLQQTNAHRQIFYRVCTIPSRMDSRLQSGDGCDIAAQISKGSDMLLHYLAGLLPQSATFTWRYAYQPHSMTCSTQDRLRLYAGISSHSGDAIQHVSTAVERGLLSHWYPCTAVESGDADLEDSMESFSWIAEVIRYEERILPLWTNEMNAYVPTEYYAVYPFFPNKSNDYLALDEIFDGLREPVLVDLAVRPYDAASERQAVSKYSRRLKTINRSMWDEDRVDSTSLDGGLDGTPSWKQPKKRILRPFHRRDPIAEEVLRDWRKI